MIDLSAYKLYNKGTESISINRKQQMALQEPSNESVVYENGVLYENEAEEEDCGLKKLPRKIAEKRTFEYKWFNMFTMSFLHVQAVYGAYLAITGHAKWQTLFFAYVLYIASGLGITAGAHRLWSHRAFKAKWQLKLMLMIFNTIAFQNSLLQWCRDHRVHHKFSDTDADPHNATRGFFFSHCGWLLIKKHPHVITGGKKVDFSDLENDGFVMFQKKHAIWLFALLCFILPTYIPYYFWNESLWNAWLIPTCLRYAAVLNITWCVNSLAHIWGHKPYDKSILASQNIIVSIIALGEGWHNYHHVFPWDYKTAELGNYRLNLTTMFIDLMARIGWAYDLKTVNKEIIDTRRKRTGDGTQTNIWGWADPD